MGNLEIIYGLLFKPSIGIRAAAEKRPFGLVVLILLFSCLAGMVANDLIFSIDPAIALVSLSAGLGLRFLFVLTGLFLLACILHFIAEGLKGEGKVSVFFILLCCSLLPGILVSPLSLAAACIKPFPLKVVFYLVFSMAIFIWTVLLQILALKEVYHLSSGRAILAYLILYMAASLFLFILLALSLLTLILSVFFLA